MALLMPYFAKWETVNAAAEYTRFANAVGDPAVHLLAWLAHVHNKGKLSDIPNADGASTRVRGLYCRRVEGWAIFYTAELEEGNCRIKVVHVGSLNPHSFDALESEAEGRLRHLNTR